MAQSRKNRLDILVGLSRSFGGNLDMVQGGGGNTSVKVDNNKMYIKASGFPLRSVNSDNFILVDTCEVLDILCDGCGLTSDVNSRDEFVRKRISALVPHDLGKRPSIEVFLHALLGKYVIHLHPVYINALICLRNGRSMAEELFKGINFLWVDYNSPGYPLGISLQVGIENHRAKYGAAPDVVFLKNHGLIISCDNDQAVYPLLNRVMKKAERFFEGNHVFDTSPQKINSDYVNRLSEAFRSAAVSDRWLSLSDSPVIDSSFCSKDPIVQLMPGSLYPDHVVYCGEEPLFINATAGDDELKSCLMGFINKLGYAPKVIVFKDTGVVLSGDSVAEIGAIREVLEAHLKTLYLIREKGQPLFLSDSDISYLAQWESEKYRRRFISTISGTEGNN